MGKGHSPPGDHPVVATGPAKVIRAAEPLRLAVNFLFLSVGEFTAKLLTFASFTYLARTLSLVSYGAIEFTLAVMVFFTLPADLGLGQYGAREIARHPADSSRLLREITGLRLLLSLGSMLLLLVFIALLQKSSEQKILLALYGVSLLGTPYLLQWFFQAHDQMHWVGAASIVRQGGFALLVFSVCRPGFPLIYIGFIECAAVLSAAVFCVCVVTGGMRYPWPGIDLGMVRLMGHIRQAFPIGLSELAWAFMWYFCTVLLGFLSPDRSLGWFGASHRAVMAMHTFVWLYFFNLLPSISRCAVLPHAYLLELMDQSVRFMAWAGLLAAPLLTVLVPQVMTLIYGPSFHDGWRSFASLVWMLPVAMLNGHHRYILIAYGHQNWPPELAAAVHLHCGGGCGHAGLCARPLVQGFRRGLGAVDRQRGQFRAGVFFGPQIGGGSACAPAACRASSGAGSAGRMFPRAGEMERLDRRRRLPWWSHAIRRRPIDFVPAGRRPWGSRRRRGKSASKRVPGLITSGWSLRWTDCVCILAEARKPQWESRLEKQRDEARNI